MQYASILFGNLLLLWSCLSGAVELGELLWAFWSQSVLIGVANAIRMGSLRKFSTEGLHGNGKPVPETPAGKRSATAFFCLHYGFFHVIYAVFLGAQYGLAVLRPSLWLVLALASFGIGEASGLWRRLASDRSWRPNLGTLMFTPYLRIIPMHLTIIAGAFFEGADAPGESTLILFMLLKTAADAGMQLADNRLDAQRRASG